MSAVRCSMQHSGVACTATVQSKSRVALYQKQQAPSF